MNRGVECRIIIAPFEALKSRLSLMCASYSCTRLEVSTDDRLDPTPSEILFRLRARNCEGDMETALGETMTDVT